MDSSGEEAHDIVIVGGGICGLATALALHRKGIKSVVLERSDTLRTTGAAIGILANGWRALHQLGIASLLRQYALPMKGPRDISLDKGSNQETSFWTGEARCLKRSDLIRTLADALPPGTVQLGCHVVSIKLVPAFTSSSSILQLIDGRIIGAKVLIGCDGANSVVAEFIGLKPAKKFALSAVRGLAYFPNGHTIAHEFSRMRGDKIVVGRAPIDDNSIYWFIVQETTKEDSKANPEPTRESILNLVAGFPGEVTQIIERTDTDTLSTSQLRYRSPWDLLFGKFRKGTATVAGDAMHVMGPFLGQGGSAGLEDAIVLVRCLSRRIISTAQLTGERDVMPVQVEEAIDEYVKERRMRLMRLSTQAYLMGLFLQPSSQLVKLITVVLMVLLFHQPNDHTSYDCGIL